MFVYSYSFKNPWQIIQNNSADYLLNMIMTWNVITDTLNLLKWHQLFDSMG